MNNEKYSFRTLQNEDYDKGMIELLGELTSIDKSKISRNEFEAYVQDVQSSPFVDTIVLESETRQIIACGTLLVERKLIHNFGIVGHLEDIVVKKEFRGKDIGKSLIEALVELARQHACYKVILDCNEKNAGFYEKCQFRRNGVEMRIDLSH